MLLTIDIGNSNIVLGIFDGVKLIDEKRINTNKGENVEFYRKELSEVLGDKVKQIEGVIIGSVVPELDEIFKQACKNLFKNEPQFVSVELDTGLVGLSENCELGADRLCNMVAAHTLYPGNAIVVDLGTATTYEVVSTKREYVGGAIGPGVGGSFKTLLGAASRLSNVRLSKPEKAVILGTTPQLNSGFVYGYSEMVGGMIRRMKEELKWNECHVIGTGGFVDLISPHVPEFTEVNKQLTLEGLRILRERNS